MLHEKGSYSAIELLRHSLDRAKYRQIQQKRTVPTLLVVRLALCACGLSIFI
ncbi:hypothetical protein IQ252_25095 [Tychonema sp. LEGE 07203]|nr:hypothetical protein [Tychonema sp. LEGE 07203]